MSRGVATLADLKDKDKEENPQDNSNTYYTGGEKSGLQVQAPKEPKGLDLISQVVENSKKKGQLLSAEEINKISQSQSQSQNQSQSQSQTPLSSPFGGQAFKAGHNKLSSEEDNQDHHQNVVKVSLYKNGFTVGKGELRGYEEPDSLKFFSQLDKGEIPSEIQKQNSAKEILLDLVDLRQQNFSSNKPQYTAFSGAGHSLSSSPSSSSSSSSQSSSSPSASSSSSPSTPSLQLDSSKPVTSVQIRLPDGSRLVGKFNHSHTVQDLKNYIDQIKPQPRQYQLLASFSRQVLSEHNQTLEEAGLLNAAVLLQFLQ
eukprot:TRINITY_DN5194_c0_g3_i1.p1 TRINITY_DN5194_c0_g3~~TRINITY_DN5194_c0_g3_i1.p1  ORF type:complete len:313 (-),score=71.88 TRINITY_DN5194_c0_g3_i1:26-964(-)